MTVPKYSPWLHWDNRHLSDHRAGPGVYLLAQFEEEPPVLVDPLGDGIILIAETHGQTLQKRWEQFHYSAFRGKWGHAGGVTFHGLFGNGPDTATPPWLYVSATPVPDGNDDVQAYVQGLKNRLLEDFQDRHGLLPCCNVKGPVDSPGHSGDAVRVASPANAAPPSDEYAPTTVIPRVQFSRWCRWADRDCLPGVDAAGVYALACFDGEPPPSTDVLDERVVYIGETCDNTLSGRLWQFNRSAFLQKNGHSGGWSFRSRCDGQAEHLHVAVFPVPMLHEPHRSAFIRYTERRLLWEYVVRQGQRPVCNSK